MKDLFVLTLLMTGAVISGVLIGIETTTCTDSQEIDAQEALIAECEILLPRNKTCKLTAIEDIK